MRTSGLDRFRCRMMNLRKSCGRYINTRANHITFDAIAYVLSRNTFYAVGGDIFAEKAVVLVHHDLVTLTGLGFELFAIKY